MDDICKASDIPICNLGDMGPMIVMFLIVLILVVVVGVMYLSYNHTVEKDGKIQKGKIRRRAIQLLAVGASLPVIAILGLVGALNSEVIAALFGTFFGYVLSGVGDDEK